MLFVSFAPCCPPFLRRVLLIGGQFTGNFCARELKKKFYVAWLRPSLVVEGGGVGARRFLKTHDMYIHV